MRPPPGSAARGLVAVLAVVACAPETRLTEDTFRIEPTLPDACVELSRRRLSFLADVGDTETLNVRVRSACEGLLELRSARLEAGTGPFDVTLPLDLTLEQGFEEDVLVTFEPLVVGTWSDRLFIRTNDPQLPVAEVVVTGEAPE